MCQKTIVINCTIFFSSAAVPKPAVQPTIKTAILNIDESANLPLRSTLDTDDEFQLAKPRQPRNRKAFVIEDDSSMDSFRGSPIKLLQGMPSNLENILEEDDSQLSQEMGLTSAQTEKEEDLCCCTWTSQYPLTHTGSLESCLSLCTIEKPTVLDRMLPLLKQVSLKWFILLCVDFSVSCNTQRKF